MGMAVRMKVSVESYEEAKWRCAEISGEWEAFRCSILHDIMHVWGLMCGLVILSFPWSS